MRITIDEFNARVAKHGKDNFRITNIVHSDDNLHRYAVVDDLFNQQTLHIEEDEEAIYKIIGKVTYAIADNGKTYAHEYTDLDGISHTLEAWCHTYDPDEVLCNASWIVQDSARQDGIVKTYGQKDEMEIDTQLNLLASKIKADFPGIEIFFDYADQGFYQV